MSLDNQALQRLIDHREISDVLTRASRALDRLDLELLKSVFWEDATDDRGVVRGNAHQMAPDLIQFARQNFIATQHILHNCSIEIDGDKAASETYVNAWHRLTPTTESLAFLYGSTFVERFRQERGGPPDEFVVVARYLDRHEKRRGEWKIASRLGVISWCNIRPGSAWPGEGAFAGVRAFDNHGPQDSVYQYLRR